MNKCMRFVVFVVLVAALGVQTTARAENFPQDTVDALCDKAELILEGTCIGNNQVQIDRIHKHSSLLKEESRTLAVLQLDAHKKKLWSGGFGRDDGKVIETKTLVLFLAHSDESNPWESIYCCDVNGTCGSCGLIWFDDSTCYCYRQPESSRPYELFSAADSSFRQIPKTIEDLRSEIETGLANSREWQRSLALEDPTERARALARYLLKSTSPKGDKGSYLHAVRQPLASIGASAVPALIQTLRNAPADEKLDTAVLVLHDIGPPASQAVRELAALLAQPDRVSIGCVLDALGSTGDERARLYLEKYTKSENAEIARSAKRALDEFRRRQAQAAKEKEKQQPEPKGVAGGK